MLFFKEKKTDTRVLIESTLAKIVKAGPFLLSFEIEEDKKENSFNIDVFGEDEDLLKLRDGQLLIALQTQLLRACQNRLPETKISILVDSNGFWKENEDRLLSLTDHLIEKALETNSTVKFRKPLSPKQRRLVHERASGNTGVRSTSLGQGIYKVIKIVPDSFKNKE